jgi:hypothetical protein
MVARVRSGLSLRAVAAEFKVTLRTVQRWLARAGEERLDRVDFSDHAPGAAVSLQRTSAELEERILVLRSSLRKQSALGEYGAEAIRQSLLLDPEWQPEQVPSWRTIHRVLERNGALDAQRRIRRPAPPKGWYLPGLSSGEKEMDQVDLVEGLALRGGTQVEVLNSVSLLGGLVGSWPDAPYRAEAVREKLLEHWRVFGLPDYVQFDNGTCFLGPSNHPGVLGSVLRMCLLLGVTPVYAPPRETGFQAAIESYNGRWQQKVWSRFEHASMADLKETSGRYVEAARARAARRIEAAPGRMPFPQPWKLTPKMLGQRPAGMVHFLRRTDGAGRAVILGQPHSVSACWPHRLVRAEVDLSGDEIRFYALRRRDPQDQPLLATVPYRLPERPFRTAAARAEETEEPEAE